MKPLVALLVFLVGCHQPPAVPVTSTPPPVVPVVATTAHVRQTSDKIKSSDGPTATDSRVDDSPQVARSNGADRADPLAVKKAQWQKVLEEEKFSYSGSRTGVMYSLSQFRADCKIHMIYDPQKGWGVDFKFERDGKEILAISGHKESDFRVARNVLYFAHFPASTTGCVVTAHDLKNGMKLWDTKLSAVGSMTHRYYRNSVTIELSGLNEADQDGEGIVRITGRESYGDYIEILDSSTGKVLAHKIYREKFAKYEDER
ncbi:MAG: hypothetical protein K8U57_08590 [Planctomycetes bacterium]|nr:hypothetical protein [Planctomycetota bacterium]